MMEFASDKDKAVAIVMTARWLPALIQSFEEGVRDLGLTVTERSHFIDGDRKACPVLGVQGRRLRFWLGLRDAMEDFLTVDRQARPVRVDPRLVDEGYGESKLADAVTGRLGILKALEESRDVADAQARIGEMADRFEWLRAVFVEEPEGEGPGDPGSQSDLQKPICGLVRTDGNVFAIIGRVRDALRRAGQAARASEFVEWAFRAGSYDEALRLCMEYVDVH